MTMESGILLLLTYNKKFMKAITKTLVSLLLVLFFSQQSSLNNLLAQEAPNKFNYQAVVKDGNSLLKDHVVNVQFTILQGSSTGIPVWTEIQSGVSTNPEGMLNLKVGDVTPLLVNWVTGPYYLNVKIDLIDGSGLRDFGTSELLSVPYALSAPVITSFDKLGIQGQIGMDPDSALFEVKNVDGQTILAVYNSGIRMFVEDGAGKGSRGGFAVGGFTPGKDETNEYFRVTKDSTRIYVDNTDSGKGSRGGFAVGGFTPGKGKGPVSNFLDLTPDNYFIGHEAGASNTIGEGNLFLGYQAGTSNENGSYNSFIGYQAGYSNLGELNYYIQGSYNTFLGYKSGYSNTRGWWNTFMGYEAGFNNATGIYNVSVGMHAGYSNNKARNVFIGSDCGEDNNGSDNVMIGNQTGQSNTGASNTFIGAAAAFRNLIGQRNVCIGNWAGARSDGSDDVIIGNHAGDYYEEGAGNVFVGSKAGGNFDHGTGNVFVGDSAGLGGAYEESVTGDYNVCIGKNSGKNLTSGDNNVFIGHNAGMFTTISSNYFFLDNQTRTSLTDQKNDALMYGNFSSIPNSQYLRINAHVGINHYGSSSYALYIVGNAYASGGTWDASDIRLKKNVEEINNALSLVKNMRGVSYNWRSDEYPEMKFSDSKQIGFVAQELEKFVPELVSTDDKGYKAVSYEKVSPILVEAIKDQQKMIETQQQMIEKQGKEIEKLKAEKSELALLREEVEELKAMMNMLTEK